MPIVVGGRVERLEAFPEERGQNLLASPVDEQGALLPEAPRNRLNAELKRNTTTDYRNIR